MQSGNCLTNFFIKLDRKPKTWEERLTLFVGYLVECKKQSNTINSYISAIKAVLKQDGIELSEDRYLLSSLTKACRWRNDQVNIKLPIQKGMVNMLILETDRYFNKGGQVYLSVMYKAIFASAYYGLLRISEIASGSHPVLVTDVHVADNKQKILFVLRTSKTHWKNTAPQLVKIESIPIKRGTDSTLANADTCPYNCLRQYIALRKAYRSKSEPFFVFSDRSPVKPEQV